MSPSETSADYGMFYASGRPAWKRAVRKIGKRFLAWKYRRFTPESEPDKIVKISGLRLLVLRGVFNPAQHFSSGVLASYVRKSAVIPADASVLDLGTGSGVVAITAGLSGARRVVATDINPDAVRCASLNVNRYDLGRVISVRQGDMFAPAGGEKFDLVLCNPPYFRGQPKNMAERAFRAGESLDWIKRFGQDLSLHLKPSGSCVISLGDAADVTAILRILTDCGWAYSEVTRSDILVEVVYLFRLTRSNMQPE